jgi:hypothetical protein
MYKIYIKIILYIVFTIYKILLKNKILFIHMVRIGWSV